MSKKQLTPPFDGAVDLPVRKGWYPCAWKCGSRRFDHPREWPLHHWNGSRFSSCGSEKHESIMPNEGLLWCGLTSPYSI